MQTATAWLSVLTSVRPGNCHRNVSTMHKLSTGALPDRCRSSIMLQKLVVRRPGGTSQRHAAARASRTYLRDTGRVAPYHANPGVRCASGGEAPRTAGFKTSKSAGGAPSYRSWLGAHTCSPLVWAHHNMSSHPPRHRCRMTGHVGCAAHVTAHSRSARVGPRTIAFSPNRDASAGATCVPFVVTEHSWTASTARRRDQDAISQPRARQILMWCKRIVSPFALQCTAVPETRLQARARVHIHI